MESCINEINKTTREIDFFFSRSKIELWCIELIFQKINSFWYDSLINLDRMSIEPKFMYFIAKNFSITVFDVSQCWKKRKTLLFFSDTAGKGNDTPIESKQDDDLFCRK